MLNIRYLISIHLSLAYGHLLKVRSKCLVLKKYMIILLSLRYHDSVCVCVFVYVQ